jgi:hypothetical protein
VGTEDDCPMPAFNGATIDQTLTAGSPGEGPSIKIRWSHDGDNVPDVYWLDARFDYTSDAALGAIEYRVDVTASHELNVRFNSLDAYLATHSTIALRVVFPDTRTVVKCRHPGMDDVYYIDVTLNFDSVHHLTSAEVSPMRGELGAI